LKLFRFLASSSGIAFNRFQNTVLKPIPVNRILSAMTTADQSRFKAVATRDRYGVWALQLTKSAKNIRVWNTIEPGDIAAFYTRKRFEYFAPIVFKWQSNSIECVAGWGAPPNGTFSLAFVLNELKECDLGSKEYCILAGFKGMPAHSDCHDEIASAEILAAMTGGLHSDVTFSDGDFDNEGEIQYRIQQFRERSDGNRFRILEKRGVVCEVCGFSFTGQYGVRFNASAQVHHKEPLALGSRRAKSEDEFAVLCASCHTAIHMGEGRKLNPWTIGELRAMIAKRWD
jgi:hypothetical protein